jgi:catechol 2,3-dioxygenase-like lactoylglutathione lyase family enzyme
VFTETLQVALVVRSLEAAMRTYVEDYGIGPWAIYEFNPGTVRNMHAGGEPLESAWRLALARVGQVHWELIEPLDDRSTYAEFLAEKGEGVHHIGVAIPSFDRALETVAEQGREIVLGGEYNGVTFAYLPTGDDLGVITEIFDSPPGEDQQPDSVYP